MTSCSCEDAGTRGQEEADPHLVAGVSPDASGDVVAGVGAVLVFVCE